MNNVLCLNVHCYCHAHFNGVCAHSWLSSAFAKIYLMVMAIQFHLEESLYTRNLSGGTIFDITWFFIQIFRRS